MIFCEYNNLRITANLNFIAHFLSDYKAIISINVCTKSIFNVERLIIYKYKSLTACYVNTPGR